MYCSLTTYTFSSAMYCSFTMYTLAIPSPSRSAAPSPTLSADNSNISQLARAAHIRDARADAGGLPGPCRDTQQGGRCERCRGEPVPGEDGDQLVGKVRDPRGFRRFVEQVKGARRIQRAPDEVQFSR